MAPSQLSSNAVETRQGLTGPDVGNPCNQATRRASSSSERQKPSHNMAPEEDFKKRIGRKLTKKRTFSRIPSVKLPERFKDGDDAQQDVTATKGVNGQYMNQSVFSMIAAAGSKVDFNSRFDDESSGSDEEHIELGKPGVQEHPTDTPPDTPPKEHVEKSQGKGSTKAGSGQQRRKTSEPKLLRSIPKLNLRTTKEKNYMSQSSHLPFDEALSPTGSARSTTPRDAPVMTRILEAEARLSSSPTNSDSVGKTMDKLQDVPEEDNSSSLAIRLMEIFGYEKPEKVIAGQSFPCFSVAAADCKPEYPCWLLQSVLLQGYMYITENHICFYAYLPKKAVSCPPHACMIQQELTSSQNVITKSGHLSKRGKQNPQFHRYWFTLKGDVLSYYTDPSDLYFPSGNIDLRYGISAALSEPKDKAKDVTHFTVTTHQRTYFFKADSAASAKEWVKTLQKVIFRSHNDGDSVKIFLPVENVIDIEESPVIEFAETFKIRVVDSDETYAIDEVYMVALSGYKEQTNVAVVFLLLF